MDLGSLEINEIIAIVNAQSAQLRHQIQAFKDLSPAELHGQVRGLKQMMSEEIARLEKTLQQLNELLLRKTDEVNKEKRTIATTLGIGSGEIVARCLYGFLFQRPGMPIDYGEIQLEVTSFYVNAVKLFLDNENILREFIQSGSEWVLDYLLLPLLSCMRFKTLLNPSAEMAYAICAEMESTPFAWEVKIYREAIKRAKSGEGFSEGILPNDLLEKLLVESEERSRLKVIRRAHGIEDDE